MSGEHDPDTNDAANAFTTPLSQGDIRVIVCTLGEPTGHWPIAVPVEPTAGNGLDRMGEILDVVLTRL